jgi:hypothetical protein
LHGRTEPNGRGTFSILKSCIITLALCIYTALHLNIPPGNATPVSLFIRKLGWIFVGIFAPEIIVYVAWGQKQRVKALSRDLAEIFAKKVSCDFGYSSIKNLTNKFLKDRN